MKTTPSMYLQEGGFSQRNQRESGVIFFDQHGREYHATIEKKTMHPCGPLEPLFQAPLMPPAMYLRVGTDRRKPYDLHVNYTKWIADLRTAHREYEAEARKLARKMYRDKFDPKDFLTEEILDVIGPKPQHVEPVIAARQGNAYVLGLTTKVDVRLAAMIEEDRPRFANLDEDDDEDFSEVVEAIDEDEAESIEDDAARRLAAARARDRERKARKRAAARSTEPAEAA